MTAPTDLANVAGQTRRQRRQARSTGGSALTGTRALVRFMVRRDRIKLPMWIAGLGLYVLYVATALPTIAPTQSSLAATAILFDSPVGRMWVGPAYGMDPESVNYERFFAGGWGLYLYLLGALMNILLIARHTRAEEQSSRSEIVRANVVGRHGPMTAALILAALANLAAGAVSVALTLGAGYATTGSLLVGAALATTGMAFAGITAVTVQLTENSRSAAGLAGAVLGVSFVVRGLGDMISVDGESTLAWFSPLGWPLQTAPYVLDRGWPLLPSIALTVATILAAFTLQARRDFGAGMLPARRGRAEARSALGTPGGLAARLQRGGALGWGIAIVLFAYVDAIFAQAMLDAADDLPPMLRDMLGGAEGLGEGYLAFLAEFSGYLGVAYVVFAIQVLLIEENRGRAEVLLATPTSRTAWAGSHLLVVTVYVALIMLVAGVAAGLGYAQVTGDWTAVPKAIQAHLNLIPGVLVVAGAAAVLYGWAPRLLVVVGWSLVTLIVFVGLFGQLLDFPDWLMQVSPLYHLAKIPTEPFELAPVLVLSAIAVGAAVLGLVGLRSREVVNKG